MEQLSNKEKIALVVFGLILLALIVQMFWKIGEFNSPACSNLMDNLKTRLETNLLLKPGIRLSASSHNLNSETVDKLIDNKPHTFWHVNLDHVGEPAWIIVDFGEEEGKTVRALGALPRKKLLRQFFRTAELMGSDNGDDWKTVGAIIQESQPHNPSWRYWKIDNNYPYRYYKMLIKTGYESGKFYSLAELAFFE